MVNAKNVGKELVLQHVKETGSVLICNLDLSLIDLPIVQKMHLIAQLRQSFQMVNTYFKFNDATQDYWDTHEFEFEDILRSEDRKFVAFREMVFSQAVGPLYECAYRQIEIIKLVYSYAEAFCKVPDIRIPSVLYKVAVSHGEMTLKIMNLKEFDGFRLPVRMDWIANFLNMLNYQHSVRMSVPKVDWHKSSVEIKRHLLSEDVDWNDRVINFTGSEAVLTGLIIDGLEKMKNPEQILRMLYMIDKAVAYKATKPIITK